MDASTTRDGAAAAVTVSGFIDSETAPKLDALMDGLFADGARRLDVDLTDVSFLSSAGLSVLISAHRRSDEFRLRRGNRIVDRLIELTGLTMLYGEPQPEPEAEGEPPSASVSDGNPAI